MDTARFLNQMADKLANGRLNSRELASLDFEADGRDISIRVRSTPHPTWYPTLRLIFGKIGSACAERGITLSQLRRITFGENEVGVELNQLGGGKIFTFPIEATVGLPAEATVGLQAPDLRAAAT